MKFESVTKLGCRITKFGSGTKFKLPRSSATYTKFESVVKFESVAKFGYLHKAQYEVQLDTKFQLRTRSSVTHTKFKFSSIQEVQCWLKFRYMEFISSMEFGSSL